MRDVLLAALLMGSCGPTSACQASPATAPSHVEPGQEFTLAPGEAVVVDSPGLRVSFERVIEDSRCPTGAVCVWAGQVVAEVKTGDGAEPHPLRPGESVTAGGYRVRLLRVEPYPTSPAAIAPSDYRATLAVDRT